MGGLRYGLGSGDYGDDGGLCCEPAGGEFEEGVAVGFSERYQLLDDVHVVIVEHVRAPGVLDAAVVRDGLTFSILAGEQTVGEWEVGG